MSAFKPEKLHVTMKPGTGSQEQVLPRRYTLTHSDSTGELFLTIGADFDESQISGWYTRLMRDEVLAEWYEDGSAFTLHVFCHVSGGLVLGSPGWRYAIFRKHLRQVLEAFRHGDRALFEVHPELDLAPIRVHFLATQPRHRRVEDWGCLAEYQVGERSR